MTLVSQLLHNCADNRHLLSHSAIPMGLGDVRLEVLRFIMAFVFTIINLR